MQTKKQDIFTTIQIDGAILPPDLLQRLIIAKDIDGLNPESFHLLPNEKVNEAINRSWNRLTGAWQSFNKQRKILPESDKGTTLTRERWLLQLFRELGYGRLITSKPFEIESKTYSISHVWQNTPIHLLSFKIDLDKRTPGVSGASKSSPHSLVQEFLNRSDDHLWGFLSNGLKLRILRDNVSLTRQAYVEFDLEAMMEGEVYADFVLLWILCHQSRVESEKPEECWLEKWSKSAQELGTKALDQLRYGVEETITILGRSFLNYPANNSLRDKLRSGDLDKQDFYRQLLRLVYRLIFLFTAEDRDLLLLPDASNDTKNIYYRYYSTQRIRHLAERQRGTRNIDLYRALLFVMQKLSDPKGCPELILPALGSFLFSNSTIPDLDKCDIRNHDFLDAIRALAFITDGGILRPVDFKNMGSEELGSIYEALLELHPDLQLDAASFELNTASGHERKTTGSYYTHTSLIQVLLETALDSVVNEALKNENPEEAILNLKICDPACGSGHFLIAAAHRMARKLAFVRTGDEEAAPEEMRKALRDIIGHCIYGVDINEMSVELCKVGLWMEALEPGKPLSFLDHRILCGNSLLGTTPALIEKGIPDDAFKPIEGDDKTYCTEYKKRNKKERESGQINLLREPSFAYNSNTLSQELSIIDELPDDSIAEVTRKTTLYDAYRLSDKYILNKLIADAWCSAFVWEKTNKFEYPITHEVFRRIQKRPAAIPDWLDLEINRLSQQYQFFHWYLEFPDVFQLSKQNEKPDNEQKGWIGGFEVVLGNPPWEKINLKDEEYFALSHPEIANARTKAIRKKRIADLQDSHPIDYREYINKQAFHDNLSKYFRMSGAFPLTGVSRINLYSVFAEIGIRIVAQKGRLGFVLASGIATDDNNKALFEELISNNRLISVWDFDNRDAIFPAVHRMYKFCLFCAGGTFVGQKEADFAFYLNRIAQLSDLDRHFTLTHKELQTINPNTRTCPTFKNRYDAALIKAIYGRISAWCLYEGSDSGFGTLKTPFNMSNDSGLFQTTSKLITLKEEIRANDCRKVADTLYLTLYESKLLHQFNHRFATFEGATEHDITQGNALEFSSDELKNPQKTIEGRYWLDEKILEQRFPGKWFLTYRKITNSANERTSIAAIIPKRPCGDSLILITDLKAIDAALICTNMNTIIFDYVAKLKIPGSNFNHWILKQLPIIPLKKYIPNDINFIVPRMLELVYTACDLRSFAEDMEYHGKPFRWDQNRRPLLRAELDAYYARLYGLSRDELRYILDPKEVYGEDFPGETFRVLKEKEIKLYGDYKTGRLVLEAWDRMQSAIENNIEYVPMTDPPPADPRVAHGYKEKEMETELIRMYVLLKSAESAQNPLKTYIVKILYIAEVCKQIKQKYPWKIRIFGPFPEGEVFEKEINNLRKSGLLENTDEYAQVADQPLLISNHGITKLHELEDKYPLTEYKNAIESIIADFQSYGAREMELRATLVYIHKTNPDFNYDNLVTKFKEIKGRKFHVNEIESAYIELVEKGYVEEKR